MSRIVKVEKEITKSKIRMGELETEICEARVGNRTQPQSRETSVNRVGGFLTS